MEGGGTKQGVGTGRLFYSGVLPFGFLGGLPVLPLPHQLEDIAGRLKLKVVSDGKSGPAALPHHLVLFSTN